ncbi:MAG: hypothetical protein IJG53_04955, partial [Eggerthellaceae bacterium]|nr:hypothetical protein [Eggerthellaceae bacterium]
IRFRNISHVMIKVEDLDRAVEFCEKVLGAKFFFKQERDPDSPSGMVCAMRPLSGCDLQISNPDGQGFGMLWVKTPGLSEGYLDGTPIRTRNGFYVTGDQAALYRERLYLR